MHTKSRPITIISLLSNLPLTIIQYYCFRHKKSLKELQMELFEGAIKMQDKKYELMQAQIECCQIQKETFCKLATLVDKLSAKTEQVQTSEL